MKRTRTGPKPSTPNGQPAKRHEVLAVDDEASIGWMLKTALERTGNVRVTYVQESRKGLALLEARHFDLLITDYRIPGINGMQLAQQARQRRPEMGILVITATPTLALREALTRIDRCELIRKPFSIHVIRQAVAGLLAASHTP